MTLFCTMWPGAGPKQEILPTSAGRQLCRAGRPVTLTSPKPQTEKQNATKEWHQDCEAKTPTTSPRLRLRPELLM